MCKIGEGSSKKEMFETDLFPPGNYVTYPGSRNFWAYDFPNFPFGGSHVIVPLRVDMISMWCGDGGEATAAPAPSSWPQQPQKATDPGLVRLEPWRILSVFV